MTREFTLNFGDGRSRELQDDLLAEVERMQFGTSSCFAIRLALEEALSNAFKHGNKSDPSKSVTVQYSVSPEALTIDVIDQGEGFDPKSVPDPTSEENLELPSGRGIVLMKSFMSEVSYEPPGNRVRMTYHRPAEGGA